MLQRSTITGKDRDNVTSSAGRIGAVRAHGTRRKPAVRIPGPALALGVRIGAGESLIPGEKLGSLQSASGLL